MNEVDHEAAQRAVARAFGAEFAPADPGANAAMPAFVHAASGQRFRYLPGGQYQMGLSAPELQAARAIFDPVPANIDEMRPVHAEQLQPFLIAERPVLTREADPSATRYRDCAAYLPDDAALAHCEALGMTLATEAQWEYACRAGTATLFTWGDALPPDAELSGWLTFDFAGGPGRANGFGLHGLFVGEWCLDRYAPSYASAAPQDGAGSRVVRGGGAFFWPWQDQEWVWCMSAMRMPGADLPDGQCGQCGFRLVRNL